MIGHKRRTAKVDIAKFRQQNNHTAFRYFIIFWITYQANGMLMPVNRQALIRKSSSKTHYYEKQFVHNYSILSTGFNLLRNRASVFEGSKPF